MSEAQTTTALQRKFVNDREGWSDREIELSKLYYLSLIVNKTENTRSNTASLVWIAVILIFISIGMGFLSIVT